MRVAGARGLGIEVAVQGAGRPVLLVHGFGGAVAAWGSALAGLADRCILAVDLPGHGSSDDPESPERVSLGPVLDDLEAVLDAAGVIACPWIGYSMGGRIALAASLLRPHRVERLVLESASPGIEDAREREERHARDEELAQRIERDGVASWAEEWERSPLFAARTEALSATDRARFLTVRRANRAGSLAAWLRGLGPGVQPSFWERLPEIGARTLILTGEGDPKFTAIGRRMAAAIPRSEHREIAAAGHTLHLEAPTEWARAIDAFLAS